MLRSTRLFAALPAAAAIILLAACGDVGQVAQDAAESAVSQVAATGKAELTQQICAPVTDGTLSAEDLTLLTGLVDAADTAGLPSDITEPLRELAAAGDQAPEDALQKLRDGCADATEAG
ncbi:MAG: hypothetical protein ABWX68_01865 [Arthrobacter sp.]|uniref:hypothetical protein n=1 Tax=Arthrobacter sp. TaxID=1667 RepID=UPI00347E5BAD